MTQPSARDNIRAPNAHLRLLRAAEERPARIPWAPLLLTALVLRAAMSAVPSLTNAATGAPAADASLKMSVWYDVLAPIGDTLDRLTLFSQGQHFAFFGTCAIAYTTWRLWRRHSRTTKKPLLFAARKECALAALALVALVSVYAAGMMMPRPTAALAMASRDAIVVDFHSHTSFSWDARPSYTPEASRRWHHASGFNVAYVTDHATFAGAAEGAAANPTFAGDGTVLLSGIEVRSAGRHLSVLGVDVRDSADYARGDLNASTFMRTEETGKSVPPVVLMTLPGNFEGMKSDVTINAIEISDAAPRGLAQVDRQRARLVDFGTRRRMAMVASSNNHGWAGASPAWSVLQIPDWRLMTPPQLDTAIRELILRRGSDAVQVVERRPPGPTSSYALSWTVPVAVWQMFTSMSWPERLSWLGWIWIGYFVSRAFKARRASRRSEMRRSIEQDVAA